MREALRQLENEGLVMSFPYRGAVVLGAVSDEEAHEVLIPIRLTLERYSFVLALEKLSDDDFAELGKQIWLMEQAGKANDLLKSQLRGMSEDQLIRAYVGDCLQTSIAGRPCIPRMREISPL